MHRIFLCHGLEERGIYMRSAGYPSYSGTTQDVSERDVSETTGHRSFYIVPGTRFLYNDINGSLDTSLIFVLSCLSRGFFSVKNIQFLIYCFINLLPFILLSLHPTSLLVYRILRTKLCFFFRCIRGTKRNLAG